MKKNILSSIAVLALSLGTGHALAKDDPIKKAQALRQAPMKLIGNNFGFMRAMAAGKIPWNANAFVARGKELGALGQLDLIRGYIEDSYEGKTRATADVELEFDDFTEKMRNFEQALQDFGGKPNADAMKAGIKDLGQNCKSCHKNYKSKEYQGS